jgi:hypothetical protein
MKIALCLSGQIRSFDLVKESWKKFFLKKDIDIFCHTYHKYDNSKYTNFYNYDDPNDYGSFGESKLEDILDTFKPIYFSYEPPHFHENSKSMFYSIYQSNYLKRSYENTRAFKYDVVIRSRYDLLFHSDPIIERNEYLNIIHRPGGTGGINDWYAYGSSEIMDIYSNIFEEYQNEDCIKALGPEKLLGDHIKKNDIKNNIISKNFSLQRKWGERL